MNFCVMKLSFLIHRYVQFRLNSPSTISRFFNPRPDGVWLAKPFSGVEIHMEMDMDGNGVEMGHNL